MTEILIDVDVGHPPERVWRALTDRAVLSEWFMQTDLEPYQGHRFRLMPEGLLGFDGPLDGELVEVVEPRRLVMLWRGEQMHSRVTWELVPLPEGCRLRLSHTGFIGVQGSLRRKELRRAYDRMLGDRLPQVLANLAAGGQPGNGGSGADEPVPPPAPSRPGGVQAVPPARSGGADPVPPSRPASRSGGVGDEPCGEAVDHDGAAPRRTGVIGWLHALPYRRRGQVLALAAAALLAVLTMAVISSLGMPSLIPPFGAAPDDLPAEEGPSAAPASPGGVPPPLPVSPRATTRQGAQPQDSAGPATATSDGTPTATPAPTGEQAAAPWQAAYRTVDTSADGFSGEITVTNTRTSPASGWAVVVTLPSGGQLTSAKKATTAQSGSTVTFTSKNSGKVGPGSSVTIDFGVTGATGPTSCRIEGRSCAGLSG